MSFVPTYFCAGFSDPSPYLAMLSALFSFGFYSHYLFIGICLFPEKLALIFDYSTHTYHTLVRKSVEKQKSLTRAMNNWQIALECTAAVNIYSGASWHWSLPSGEAVLQETPMFSAKLSFKAQLTSLKVAPSKAKCFWQSSLVVEKLPRCRWEGERAKLSLPIGSIPPLAR